CWSTDGGLLACRAQDGTIRLLEPETLKELRKLAGSKGVSNLRWSPDSKTVAASRDGSIHLWDPGTGVEIRPLEGHECFVEAVCWSPDGKIVCSGSWDETIRLWDPGTGKLRRTLQRETGLVQSTAWSRDGKRLAWASNYVLNTRPL